MMLLYSFADLAMNSGSIYRNIRNAGININPVSWFREDPNYNADEDEDLSPREDRVPTLWWTAGLAASVIMCCAILATMFSMNVGEAILSLVLGFVFSFIGVQSAGTTDVNPVSTVAKVSPFLYELNSGRELMHIPPDRHHNSSSVELARARAWLRAPPRS